MRSQNRRKLLHVCLSVRKEQLDSQWTDFHKTWYLNITWKSVTKIQFPLNLTRIKGTLYGDVFTFMTISRWILPRMRNVSEKFVEIIKTHILCSITFFFRKSCRLWDNVETYGRARKATDYSGNVWQSQEGHRLQHHTTHALYMLYN
jgi:hypothetical protein